MIKSRHLILILAFLLVQTVALLHMAEHGFADHSHDGHVCDIALFSKTTHLADSPAGPIVLPSVASLVPVKPTTDLDILTRLAGDRPLPRAPPPPTSPL